VSLALLVGPANAGKVATLLDRYVAALDREPYLVVPNRGEVERIERDILARVGGLVGGWIGTFDDLFERIARASAGRPALTPLQRSLLLRHIVDAAALDGLRASARYEGFVESLDSAVGELEAARVEPSEVDGELGLLQLAYREELRRLERDDPHGRTAAAAQLVGRELDTWHGSPLFVYGFEDMTGPQWALVEALAGRVEVTVSLPYEPGRAAFAVLARTAGDLAGLARGAVEELPAQNWYEANALAHLERTLFEDPVTEAPPLDGAVRFLEAAGSRAALELVGEEILALLRGGTPAGDIAVVAPGLERARTALEAAFAALGVPYAIEGRLRLRRTPFGRALLGLLRFAWLDGGRRDLFSYLRSPYSGLPRARADFVEGRLRGRAISDPARVEEETAKLLGRPLDALERLRNAGSPLDGVRELGRAMLRAAWGVDRPPVDEAAELDLRADETTRRTLDELAAWQELEGRLTPDELVAALERASVFMRAEEHGRVAVLDLLRARTRRFGYVFVLGMQDGVLPRRVSEPAFLGDDERRRLEERDSLRRLVRGDEVARDRYLFYTACTRAWKRLTLVREAATDDGRPLEPSPFYEEVRSRFAPGDADRWTRRRRLSELSWELSRAPTERERLRSLAALAAEDETAARSLAAQAGWSRQMERALAAFTRPTRLASPAVLRQLGEVERFSVTELEQFGDCSSMWLFEKVVTPRTIDGEIDARLRGGVAHQALYRFYSGLPKRLGVDAVDEERLDEALAFLHECLRDAIAGQVRLEVAELDLLELEATLARDLEHFVRRDAALGLPLVPRRFEVAFGSDRAAPELQRGLDLGGFTVSGKIDRIDVDPFSARGIVQDYKSGEAHSAARIQSDRRLQIPLYVLALRDLVGMEPLGGLYRSLSGEREARGLVRESARDDLPGLAPRDYVDEAEFWGAVEAAEDRARAAVARIRAGDVRHDPRWSDGCPSWCKLGSMCRVARP
jgi:ATP-dependent helicase/DNAse subunit B